MHAKKDNTVSFCQDERFLAVKVVASAVKKEVILNGGYPLFLLAGIKETLNNSLATFGDIFPC